MLLYWGKMKRLLQILMAISFGILLVLIYSFFRLDKLKEWSGIGLIGLTASMGGLYYFLFERKKKK